MSDDLDPMIRRLFAEQDQSPRSDDFMLHLGKRIDRQQRMQRVHGRLVRAACLVLSVLAAPWVAQGASALIELVAATFTGAGPLFNVPLTWWVVVGGTIVGCSPIIYLWRTGRW